MRVGDDNPRTQLGRLMVKLRLGLVGEIPDGLLVRISTISADHDAAFKVQADFIRALLLAIAPPNREFVVGALAPAVGV
jgi:hypothetical protein